MKKIILLIVCSIFLFENANAEHKYVPCAGNSKWQPLKFSNGNIFCEERARKTTIEYFLKSKINGHMIYPNKSHFEGKFKNGKRLEGEYFDHSLNKWTYQKYGDDKHQFLIYEVSLDLQRHGKCKLKNNNVHYKVFMDWSFKMNRDIFNWCVEQYSIVSFFGVYKFLLKRNYIWPIIVFISILLLILFLYIRKRNLNNKKNKIKLSKTKITKLEKKTKISDNNINDDNLLSKIKRLKSLYKKGILTKDEFEKAKNKLLK
tara:strand:- start:28 stop:804 length:777 start_codon:yes stop_codon:yes gene_type:complete